MKILTCIVLLGMTGLPAWAGESDAPPALPAEPVPQPENGTEAKAAADALAAPLPAPVPDAPDPSAKPGTAAVIPPGALEVTASGTLEWLREDQMYVARQNAVAKRNDTTVKADVLVAHYQIPEGKKDGMEISQVTADGNVELLSPTSVAYGQHGVYDLPKHVVVLVGDNLKLITTSEVITARDSLEYFEDLDTGVARGNAVAVRGEDRLTADTIAAKFTKNAASSSDPSSQKKPPPPQTTNADGSSQPSSHSLERLDAKGNVVLVTATDVVTGDEGVYNPITDQATVIGKVHVTRGDNQLDGARAEVDMATGISRVFAAPNTRVRGLFVPKKKDASTPADAPPTVVTATTP